MNLLLISYDLRINPSAGQSYTPCGNSGGVLEEE